MDHHHKPCFGTENIKLQYYNRVQRKSVLLCKLKLGVAKTRVRVGPRVRVRVRVITLTLVLEMPKCC